MSMEEELYMRKQRFKFTSRRKSKGNNFRKDNGDLSQMAIIIAGLTVAGIVVTGGISSITQTKGKSTAECINNSTGFGQGAVARDNCKKTDEEAQEKGEEAIGGNFGESSPIGGSEPEKEEEEPIIPTSDTCFVLNAQGDTITDYKIELEECTTDVVIPSSINGITIVGIGYAAFSQNQLTSVNIPNSVTNIEGSAFNNNQLTSVIVPDSVTNIGTYAFYRNHLTSANISDSVTNIGNYAFSNNQLTSVSIPDSITSIGTHVFSYNQLASATIPDSVTSIGNYAFTNNQLASIAIPDSVTSIGTYAFRDNQLTSVNISNSATSIGSHAFRNNQLTSVVIPDSVTSIGTLSFYDNPLTSASVPSSLRLGSTAFPKTTNITIRS